MITACQQELSPGLRSKKHVSRCFHNVSSFFLYIFLSFFPERNILSLSRERRMFLRNLEGEFEGEP